MSSEVSGPLAGFTIIDMTSELAGPYAARMMGDLGANIVKVEPIQGDGQRNSGPARRRSMGSQFLHTNRSKRSIAIDLKNPAGREVLLTLCKTADVIIYNVRPLAMARLKLTYDDVAAVNARIVYCGICGYGSDGPYQDMPAYDDVIQGMTAMPALQAELTGGKPRYLPLNVVDRNSGLVLVQTVLAALLFREKTGQGQAVQLPLFETLAEYVLSEHLWGRTFEPPIGPMKSLRVMNRWPLKTRDGYVCFWFARDSQYERFWDVIERSEMKADKRFTTRVSRNEHLVEFLNTIEPELMKKDTDDWIILFRRADLPVMPMHTLETLMEDPHLRQVGFIRKVEHPSEGTLIATSVPSRWSKSKPSNNRHAPLIGEHTFEVLLEAGLAQAEIDSLVAAGAVHRSPECELLKKK